MPDELLAVPNFDSERLFVHRMGDKKDLVGELLVLAKIIYYKELAI